MLTGNTNAAPPAETIRGMEIVRLPALNLMGSRLPIPVPCARMRDAFRSLRAWKPDAIVTNTRFFPMSALGAAAARRLRVPHLHIEHGSGTVATGSAAGNAASWLVDRLVGSRVLRSATEVVGVSGAVVDFVRTLGADRCGVLPNGVDTSLFGGASRCDARKRMGIPESALVFLFAGRLYQEKGVDVLLSAFRSFRNRPAETVLAFAGDGPMGEAVAAAAREDPAIRALGFVPPENMPEMLAASDILVHPSVCREGLPTAVLEAGAAGKAIVATPAGGTGEMVVHGVTGILVPMGDAEALGRAMESLLRDAGMRERLGGEARRRVAERFDWEAVADLAVDRLRSLRDS